MRTFFFTIILLVYALQPGITGSGDKQSKPEDIFIKEITLAEEYTFSDELVCVVADEDSENIRTILHCIYLTADEEIA